jgi:hypothetical protein
MAYIGNEPTSAAFVTDLFSGNASTTAFTMTVAPANTASILVAVSGVVQSPDTYSISGTTLTFSAAPPTGTGNISVRYLGIPATNVTTTAYRTVTEFTATAGQTTFSIPSYTVGYVDVYRNGVRLGTADYTATSGTSVVLANAATLGDLVATESFYVSSVLNAIPATGGAINTIYLDAGNANGTGALLTPSGTTGQRPASPIVGMQRWNTTIGGMEVYIGTGSTGWQTIASTAYSVDYLIVAGGGGGSYGGGGAGGLLQGSSISVSPGTSYTVTIGAGGTASSSGSDSSVFSLTAIGGGGGYVGGTGRVARSGGSGAGTQFSAGNSGVAGSGTAGQGNNGGTGGDGVSAYTSGGGGGGAGAVGASTSTTAGAAGGVGLASSISGSSVFYAGGGGGTTNSGSSYGTGGSGGGGNATGGTGTSGTANTGGGAGAGASVGGAGGSGIVIIRYLGTVQRATGGTVTITGGYVIHTFTSSGTFTA